MSVLLQFAKGIDWVNERFGRLVCWLTLAMVLVASYNTIARYCGRYVGRNLTSNALLETQWYLFSAVFLLGAAYALIHNVHVRVDVMYAHLGARVRAWINLIGGGLLLLPFSIFAIWASWRPVMSSWQIQEMSPDPGGLPRYPIKMLIPVAFVLLILQGIAEMIKIVVFLRQGGEEPGSKEDNVGSL